MPVRTFALALGMASMAASACAQGTNCADFLHEHDGSWRSFTNDEMLLPRGPVPIHEGERFPRGSFVARLLDAQCQAGNPPY